jgi:hypothetical protein
MGEPDCTNQRCTFFATDQKSALVKYLPKDYDSMASFWLPVLNILYQLYKNESVIELDKCVTIDYLLVQPDVTGRTLISSRFSPPPNCKRISLKIDKWS